MVTNVSLGRLAEIVREAGTVVMAYYAQAGQVEFKADKSPVTAADRAAHRVIVDALGQWADIPIVSEEGDVAPFTTRKQWSQFWLVDPLDGTKEFLNHNGEFTVNVALIEHGIPVLSAVLAPALDVLYLAARGLGAWRQHGSAPAMRLQSWHRPAGTAVVVAESRSHASPELEAYLRTIPVARRVRAGSSLKFCLVAEGKADIYPRFGPTMEWDTAAGDCVYRQSGRHGERRSPLRYNTPTLRHGRFVIGLPPDEQAPA